MEEKNLYFIGCTSTLRIDSMIISKLNNGIGLCWREKSHNKKKIITHAEFQPYMFVQDMMTIKHHKVISAKDNSGRFQIKLNYQNGDYVNLEGEPLLKVTWTPNNPIYRRIRKFS